MRIRPRFLFVLLMLLVPPAGHFATLARAGELSLDEFRKLHRQLRRSRDEPWLTIPWKTSLLGAQRAAARAKKPIFIWAMDGHPLGCT